MKDIFGKPKKAIVTFSILFCSLVLPSCATTGTIRADYKNPQIFNYSFDVVWDEVGKMIQSRRWIIREMDKTSGFIATDWKPVGGGFGMIFSKAMTSETYMCKYTFSIRAIDENNTSVQVICNTGFQNTYGRIESSDWMGESKLKDAEMDALNKIREWLETEPRPVPAAIPDLSPLDKE